MTEGVIAYRRKKFTDSFQWYASNTTSSKRISALLMREYERGLDDVKESISGGNQSVDTDSLLHNYKIQILSNIKERESVLYKLEKAYEKGLADGKLYVYTEGFTRLDLDRIVTNFFK